MKHWVSGMEIGNIELIGGHPALDFVNSVEGLGSANELNYLPDFGALISWLRRVGLLSEDIAGACAVAARRHPVRARRVWEEAMELRRALAGIVHALARHDAPPAKSLAKLAEAFVTARSHQTLARGDGSRLIWKWREREARECGIAADTIAIAAATLLTDASLVGRIKTCANGPCDWVFLDTSRNCSRRWCRMAVCGNVSKVREFRARQRAGRKS